MLSAKEEEDEEEGNRHEEASQSNEQVNTLNELVSYLLGDW